MKEVQNRKNRCSLWWSVFNTCVHHRRTNTEMHSGVVVVFLRNSKTANSTGLASVMKERKNRPARQRSNNNTLWSTFGPRSAVLGCSMSYVFGRRRGNSCPPPGESAGGGARRPGRSLLSGHRRRHRRSAVFGRQRPRTVRGHVQQQSPPRSRTVVGRFQENRRHVAQSRHGPGGARRQGGRPADHCCRSVFLFGATRLNVTYYKKSNDERKKESARRWY